MVDGLLNIAFFVLVILGMIAGVGIAVVMALVGKKKIKPIVWIGMCALGMVLMVLSPLAMVALQYIGDWYGGMSLGGVIWNLANIVVYLCAAAFMMCVGGKKKPLAVLLMIPVVLYVAAVKIDAIVNNLKYGGDILGAILDTLRTGGWHVLWFLSWTLVAVWYLTGRKKTLGVIAAVVTAISLIGGLMSGIRWGFAYLVYALDNPLLDILKIGLLDVVRDLHQAAWKPLVFAFMSGWTVSHCILSVQVIQACILSNKFGGAEDKKVPASNKAPKPVAEATAAGKMSSKFCPNCGVRLPEGSAFCNMCGSKIG